MSANPAQRARLTDWLIRSVMSRPAVAVAETATLTDALRAFTLSGLHHLVVIDSEGYCTGLLADRTIAGVWALDPMCFDEVAVGRILGPEAPVVTGSATIAQAARVMHRLGTDAVVVVDGAGRPLGVLTAGDLIALLAKPPTVDRTPLTGAQPVADAVAS
ncbi:MAG: CBS domain-containing protein [Hamadaea sp.]|nr:CBS domain-containing protein [Hamadaea sp.]